MERWDAVVVGAGPAGARCALGLARAGARVLVVDRAAAGRDKPCGEGLLPRGVEALLRGGLSALVEGAPRIEAIALHANGRTVEARFRGAAGIGVRRAAFDRRLVERAAAAGAVVRFGARVRGVERGRAGAVVRLERGAAVASLVVGADGVRSTVRRALGLEGGGRRGRVGVVGHAEGEQRAAVDFHFAHGLQIALTPVAGGAVSVAALVEPARAGELAGGAAAWLDVQLAALRLPLRVAAARVVPLGGAARAAAADRGLLVGDAAYAVDPIIGCGIALALETGEAAAAAILAALDGGGARALAGYARSVARMRRAPSWAAASLLALARSPGLAAAAGALGPHLPGVVDGLLARVSG